MLRQIGRMISDKYKRLLFVDPPPLQLRSNEVTIAEGRAVISKGFMSARVGRLVLTSQRIIWHETTRTQWPARPKVGDMELRDIRSVDKGTWLDVIGGGTPLRLRLKSGKDKCFWDDEGRLDEWVSDINQALKSA